ncbi:hypothetical protein [Cryobacterium sp. Sr3]|uniref:hypothetical protein n=1 Tax=Cryobacterium sp. Sr3 TaxID=1259194 RepID=UPI00106BB460|nr:hypothetical protein [Cryobacterium sp. Sr3]TFB58966.1 hypothetical protein E3N94_04030 [Cryobacterium sp. Sr3]
MDLVAMTSLYVLLFSVVGACLALLLLYGIIRVAVARGMRDHYLWLEKNRPAGRQMPPARETIGQYLGFSNGPITPERSSLNE